MKANVQRSFLLSFLVAGERERVWAAAPAAAAVGSAVKNGNMDCALTFTIIPP